MSSVTASSDLTPDDVDRASRRDAKHYERINGTLKAKALGFWELFIAVRIAEQLNRRFYPHEGAASVEVTVYCFDRPDHGRKPDVVFLKSSRFAGGQIPGGDVRVVPDLVAEVLSPANSGKELEEKLDEYSAVGVPLVWIVNPDGRTIRVYRNDGTTKLFRAQDVIENEPLLPGFRMIVADVFPPPTA